MTRSLLLQVQRLAGERCDYCRMPAEYDPLPFQLDHIIGQQHGGHAVLENLAWSCLHCKTRESSRISERASGTVPCQPRGHRAAVA